MMALSYVSAPLRALLVIASCIWLSCTGPSEWELVIPQPSDDSAAVNKKLATFAGGCFWHSEIVFQSLEGVYDAVAGYSGEQTDEQIYAGIGGSNTGLAECVQICYDSTRVSFSTLLDAYFESVDPTQRNRQGNDVGAQYRTIVFYRNDSERKQIEEKIEELSASQRWTESIVTEIRPFIRFYAADVDQQEYVLHHPNNKYVKTMAVPAYLQFRDRYQGSCKPLWHKRNPPIGRDSIYRKKTVD